MMMRPCQKMTRRQLLGGAAAVAGAFAMGRPLLGAEAPTAPVAVAPCKSYGPELVTTMEKMFDQIGGLGRLVNGKTVPIKINLTGSPPQPLFFVPAGV